MGGEGVQAAPDCLMGAPLTTAQLGQRGAYKAVSRTGHGAVCQAPTEDRAATRRRSLAVERRRCDSQTIGPCRRDPGWPRDRSCAQGGLCGRLRPWLCAQHCPDCWNGPSAHQAEGAASLAPVG